MLGTMHIMDQDESEGENHNESLEELVTHSDDGPLPPLQNHAGSQRIDLANIENPVIINEENSEFNFGLEDDGLLQLTPSGLSSPMLMMP